MYIRYTNIVFAEEIVLQFYSNTIAGIYNIDICDCRKIHTEGFINVDISKLSEYVITYIFYRVFVLLPFFVHKILNFRNKNEPVLCIRGVVKDATSKYFARTQDLRFSERRDSPRCRKNDGVDNTHLSETGARGHHLHDKGSRTNAKFNVKHPIR